FDPGYFAYTLGKLQILELREELERELGDRFSLQRFHDELLSHGAPPLALIRDRVRGALAPESAPPIGALRRPRATLIAWAFPRPGFAAPGSASSRLAPDGARHGALALRARRAALLASLAPSRRLTVCHAKGHYAYFGNHRKQRGGPTGQTKHRRLLVEVA